MAEEQKTKLRLEIAHVLFIDIVGYSKLLIDEQSEALHELNEIVRNTETAREAEASGQLIILPTGDGMALVFTGSVEDPVECALQISQALRAQPSLPVRMGIHSGPVHHVLDANQRDNIAGAGINIAQRVMDCGDAGHILVSKRVADDLAQYRRWQPYLHELGDFEVKHGVVVSVVNLYADVVGNPSPPERLKRSKRLPERAGSTTRPRRSPAILAVLIGGLMLFILVALAIVFAPAILRQVRVEKNAIPVPTAAPKVSPRTATISEKSVAVLPFDNLSDEKANAYFTDGVQDEILTDLAKIADLKVISRSSVMQYKSGVPRDLRKIGEELGVAYLLEGSVQRAANRVRVNAQLIDSRTDAHVWAQRYDRDLADVFAIQAEIAKAIADQLQARLSASEKSAIERAPTADVTAFDLYTQAKTVFLNTSFSANNSANLLQAVDLLNKAVARDPSFFQAYCLLASAHDNIYFLANDHTPARLAAAEAAIQSASRLRPDAGETHLARAENLYRGYYDYDGALAELEIALSTLPNDPRIPELTGYILRRRGKSDEALHSLLRSLELDPRNFLTLQQTALSYQYLRRYPEMARVLDRGLAIKPDDVETRAARASVDFDWKADTRPMHQLMEELRARNPEGLQRVADTWLTSCLAERDPAAAEAAITALGENAFNYSNGQVFFNRLILEGLVARMMKNETKARTAFTAARAEQEKVVQSEPNYGPALSVLGLIDAALGKKDEALRETRRAIELLPVEKDALAGPQMIEMLAMSAAWLGDKDLALQQLSTVMRLPCALSYGQLKRMPYWDPLRGDPRFDKIVTSLAPKE